MADIARREFIKKGFYASAAVLGTPLLLQACADGEVVSTTTLPVGTTVPDTTTAAPLKVGYFTALTGPLALGGGEQKLGWDFFAEERQGQVSGRLLEVVVEDTEGNPEVALTKVRKLVQQDAVDVLIGGLSAAIGLPVFEFVNENEVPWVSPSIANDQLTQRLAGQNRFMIRTGYTASQQNHPLGEWAYDELGYRNVVTIGFDFPFGWEQVAGFQRTFEGRGGTVVNKIWTELGTPDYSPFLSGIDRDADAVFAAYSSASAVSFLQQYQEVGLRNELPLIGPFGLTYESVLRGGDFTDDHVVGIHTASRFSAVHPQLSTRDWATRFIAETGDEPADTMADAYTAGRFLEAALEKTGGDTSDAGAFADAFIGLRIDDSPLGPIEIDEDRNPVFNVYIRRTSSVEEPPVPGYELPWMNEVVETFEGVSQYWTFDKGEYLEEPAYGRDYPPVSG